ARFYHLQRSAPEAVLAMLSERSLQAGWQVVIRGRDPERLDHLDRRLWLGADETFLPHGLAGGPHDADQPVLLTRDAAMPNGAQCLIAFDMAEVTAAECAGLARLCIVFDGMDEAAVALARDQWRVLTAAGVAAQYWSEEDGRWTMKAESGAPAA